LPLPERRVFRIDDYKLFPEQIGVQTKRGCVFKCIYCSYPYLSGSRISLRSPGNVGDDIERLAAEGVKRIFFTDCIFNYPKEHAVQICHEIIKRKLKVKWKAFFNEKFMDTEIMSAAEEAGCELFIFGPDGTSGETLKSLEKNFNYEEMIKAYDLFRAPSGAGFKCAFMFNVPGETVKTALNLAKLIVKLFFRKRFIFTVGNMRIYPWTELRRAAIKKRVIKDSTNLIKPVYYDPFPLKPVSCLLNHMENIIYTVKRLNQSDRIG
jgi:anaerobic magnesium-protoporphyrin IX monomethyl ester cyclase